MMFDNKPATTLTVADLERLIPGEVREGQRIDYKQALPEARNPLAGQEFRLDVVAFANADGGYLVYGMAEEDLLPVRLDGLAGIDPDRELERLKGLLLSDIAPRVPGVTMHALALVTGAWALVVHVPRSWDRPHWVTRERDWVRFVTRHDAGKSTLDYRQARDLFLGAAGLADRVRQFRVERVARILAGEMPAPVGEGPKLVLHLVPFAAFEAGTRVAVAGLADYRADLNPLGVTGWSHRYNLDGFLTFDGVLAAAPRGWARAPQSYLQVFRDGCMEAVETGLVWEPEGQRRFSASHLQDTLLTNLPCYLRALEHLGVQPPVAILLSLLGVAGCTLAVTDQLSRYPAYRAGHVVDRDVLLLPEALVESYDSDLAAALRPVFDAVWNAAGWPYCMHYDAKTGAWQRLG